MTREIKVTKEGYDKLKHELDDLIKNKRPAVIARIARAREFGDLSENSEYDDARDEQSFIEGRIEELENILKRAQVVSGSNGDSVSIGSTVKVEVEGGHETYQIVGATESDPIKNKISVESPIGNALIGANRGDEVKVKTPGGEVIYKIVEIR